MTHSPPRLDVLAAAGLLGGLTLLLPLVVRAQEEAAARAACADRLQRLGQAFDQYAQEHGAFPHVGPLDALDGDAATNHAPRAYRALLWGGYLDDPEALICPASDDAAAAAAEAAREDPRRWFWGGATAPGDPPASPLAPGETQDPALLETTELSYGYTRRGLDNATVPGFVALAADRAVRAEEPAEGRPAGNHVDGWNLLRVDGSVSWLPVASEPFPGAFLLATGRDVDDQRGAHLALVPQPDRASLRARGPLDHVRPGQKYRFALQNNMEQVWEVTDVGKSRVGYEIITYMDMGQGLAPVGEPVAQEFAFEPDVKAGEGGGPALPPGTTTREERLTVGATTFTCLVVKSKMADMVSESWIPIHEGTPVFPGVVRVFVDGELVMNLVEIRE